MPANSSGMNSGSVSGDFGSGSSAPSSSTITIIAIDQLMKNVSRQRPAMIRSVGSTSSTISAIATALSIIATIGTRLPASHVLPRRRCRRRRSRR